jgi:zinc protease
VIILPTRRLPLVDLRLVTPAGLAYDPKGKEGLSELTSQLLTQGAGVRTAKQVADEIAFVGGALEAFSGTEQLVVTCEVLSKDFATGLALFRDAVVAPAFAPEEFARRKDEALGQIASDRSEPEAVAEKALLPFVLGESPLTHPGIGWESSVKALTRDDVVKFHRDFVTPEGSTLVLVGDVDEKSALRQIEEAFKDWKRVKRSAAMPYASITRMGGRAVRIVKKPEATQTQIRFACPSVARSHPDYYPIRVANTILGAGFTSRLVNEIRVVQGLTYSINSGFAMHRNAGVFRVTTFTRNESLRKCVDEVLKSMRTLVEQGPTQEELDKAKRFLTGQYPLDLQAPDDLAARLADASFYALEPGSIESFPDRIEAVAMEDVRRALKSYFCVGDLKLLVVSNPEVARKALEGLGPIDEVEIP